MVIDPSVIPAILFDEPERLRLVAAVEAALLRLLFGRDVFVEATLVVEGRKGRPADIAHTG